MSCVWSLQPGLCVSTLTSVRITHRVGLGCQVYFQLACGFRGQIRVTIARNTDLGDPKFHVLMWSQFGEVFIVTEQRKA